MALVKCRECKRKISDTAQFCPHCGYDYRNAPVNQPEPARKPTHKAKNTLVGIWDDIICALEDVWYVTRGFLLGLLVLAGFIAVVLLFIYLLDWIARFNEPLAAFIGITVFYLVLNLSGFLSCYKWGMRKKWFFWFLFIMTTFGYVCFLAASFGIIP